MAIANAQKQGGWMLASMSPDASFLNQTSRWLAVFRRLVIAPTWRDDQAATVEPSLQRVSDYARNRRHDDVADAADALLADWRRYAAKGEPPAEARVLLRRGAQLLFHRLAELAAADPDAVGLPVYALLPDGEVSALVIQGFRAQGLHITVVHDGDALESLLHERLPEALIAETNLVAPLSEVLDRLSRSKAGAAQIPIVAVASADDPTPRLAAVRAGADVYAEALEDPSLAIRLRRLLAEYSHAPYRVLVVDDDTSSAMLAQAVLRRVGFVVTIAHDAASARKAVAAARHDLILLDLEMPGEGGLSVAAALRGDDTATLMPIVFLSGESSDQTRVEGTLAGGDDYLVKPVRPRDLIAVVRTRIKRARALGRALQSRMGSTSGHLRRGAFLDHAAQVLRSPPLAPVALIMVAIDQIELLRADLGVLRMHALELALMQRLQSVLSADDRYCQLDDSVVAVLVVRMATEDVIVVAQSLVDAVGATEFVDAGRAVPLTASAGVARRPTRDPDLEVWLQHGISALEAARRAGGDRVEGNVDRRERQLPPEWELRVRALLATATQNDWRIDYTPLLPLRADTGDHYLVDRLLMDPKGDPVAVPRADYMGAAHSLELLDQLDRNLLAAQWALLLDYARHGRALSLTVPVTPALLDWVRTGHLAAQGGDAWASASGRLLLEVDSDVALDDPQRLRTFAQARRTDVVLAVRDNSGRFGHWPNLMALPFVQIRLPLSGLVDANDTARNAITAWRASGRTVVVDEVRHVGDLSVLWSLGIDHIAGLASAPPGARPDFDFASFAG